MEEAKKKYMKNIEKSMRENLFMDSYKRKATEEVRGKRS